MKGLINPGIIEDITWGRKGANIAIPARKHTIMFIRLHFSVIILGRGISVNSAPLIPFDSERAPKASTMKTDSNIITIMIFGVGLYIIKPIIPVIVSTKNVRRMMKKYLLFTSFWGEMGDVYSLQTAWPSSPIMMLPMRIVIIEAGRIEVRAKIREEMLAGKD